MSEHSYIVNPKTSNIMKKNFTFSGFSWSRKATALTLAGILFFMAVVLISCYKFRSIGQPSTGYTNSYFDVPIVGQRDDDPGLGDDEWATTLQNIGLFGVMLPVGWTVDNNIPYTIISKNPSLNNTGFLIYDADHSETLKDSIPAMPGYYWWGAITDRIAELTSLDSFYFTPRIRTDGKTGSFFLRYAVGDRDYWDRDPADRYNYGGGLSDPMGISISSNVGVADLLAKANVSLYPNPTRGIMHVKLKGYRQEVITMNVYNSAGKVVRTDEILSAESEFDLSDLPKGAYIVELRNGSYHSRSRIILN